MIIHNGWIPRVSPLGPQHESERQRLRAVLQSVARGNERYAECLAALVKDTESHSLEAAEQSLARMQELAAGLTAGAASTAASGRKTPTAPTARPATQAALTPAALDTRNILWVDTETTGKSAALGHQIIEIAIAETTADGEIIYSPIPVFVRLESWALIDAEAMKIHGVDPNSAEFSAKSFSLCGVMNRFAQRAEKCRIGGHYVSFDLAMIRGNASRVGIRIPDNLTRVCTCQLARDLTKAGKLKAEDHSLSTLTKLFSIPHTAHRAAGDLAATIELYRRLRALEASV